MEDPSVSDDAINVTTETNIETYSTTFERRIYLSPYVSPYPAPAITNNPSAFQSTPAARALKVPPPSSAHPEQCFKLRGLNLPGMGGFDGGGSKARFRYAKKPPSSEDELRNSSAAVQADEVLSKKTSRAMAGKKDDTATARASTQPVRNEEVVNPKFGKKADWRVSKIPRKQKKSEVRKLKERVERLEKRKEAANEGENSVDPTILSATSA